MEETIIEQQQVKFSTDKNNDNEITVDGEKFENRGTNFVEGGQSVEDEQEEKNDNGGTDNKTECEELNNKTCTGDVSPVASIIETTEKNDEIFPCYPAPPLEIKLFAGKIPRSYTEDSIRAIFEEYGKVVNVSLVKDRNSNDHKGYAFIKMACLAQADAAVEALNNKKVLDEHTGFLHVKYATGEAEKLGISDSVESEVNQRKLFVGNLPKTMTEESIKEFFSAYGQVDELFVMKDSTNATGKGCAFVRFVYKEQAVHAVKSLDKKHTFEGCSGPLEVRFTESKVPQHQMLHLPAPLSTLHIPVASLPLINSLGQVGSDVPIATGPQIVVGGTSTPITISSSSPTAPTASVLSTLSTTPAGQKAGVWKEYWNHDGRPYYHNEATNTTQWNRPAEFDQQITAVPSQVGAANTVTPSSGYYQALQNASVLVGQRTPSTPAPASGSFFPAQLPQNVGVAGSTPKPIMGSASGGLVSEEIGIGPKGANLFIFHVPPEWTQADLLAAFTPFGNVISARVATEKTMPSKAKGYAFVSFDNVLSAATAINSMNGFVWGGKKLKVSVKKGEESMVEHLLISTAATATLATCPSTAISLTALAAGYYGGLLPSALALGSLATVGSSPAAGAEAALSGLCVSSPTAAAQVATNVGTLTGNPAVVPGAAYALSNGAATLVGQPASNASTTNQYILQQNAAQCNGQQVQYNGAYTTGRYAPY